MLGFSARLEGRIKSERSKPVPTSSPHLPAIAAPPAIEAEPDVPWGKGGIDDYGWTAWEQTPPAPAPPSED